VSMKSVVDAYLGKQWGIVVGRCRLTLSNSCLKRLELIS